MFVAAVRYFVAVRGCRGESFARGIEVVEHVSAHDDAGERMGGGEEGASERELPVHGVSVHTDSMLALSEKVARIKQAREEAYKEVRQYEDQLKDQLKSAEAGGAVQGDKSAKLAQETEKQLMDIRKSAEVKKSPKERVCLFA